MIYQSFLLGENKACLNKSRGDEAGEKVHTTSMLWKVPKEFVIFYAACGIPDTLLAVLKSTVMQGNKIKSGTWSCIAAATASGRQDSIPFLLISEEPVNTKTYFIFPCSKFEGFIKTYYIRKGGIYLHYC